MFCKSYPLHINTLARGDIQVKFKYFSLIHKVISTSNTAYELIGLEFLRQKYLPGIHGSPLDLLSSVKKNSTSHGSSSPLGSTGHRFESSFFSYVEHR